MTIHRVGAPGDMVRIGITALAAFSQPLLFVPARLYRGNLREFQEPLGQLMTQGLLATLAAAAIVTLIGMLLPASVRRLMSRVLLALALLVWIQSAFLVWDFGPFDGTTLPWSDHLPEALLEAGIWLAMLTIIPLAARRVDPHVTMVALLVLGIQAIAVLPAFWSRAEAELAEVPRWPPAGIFAYSAERNIVQVFLDCMRTDVFLKAARSDPALARAFGGFAVYMENLTPHSYTLHAFPSTFVGHGFDGHTMADGTAFETTGFARESFLKEVAAAGIDVNLTFSRHTVFPDAANYRAFQIPFGTLADLFEAGPLSVDQFRLLDATAFRTLPILARRWLFTDDGRFLQTRLVARPEQVEQFEYFDHYLARLNVAGSEPRYHFLYLLGAHPPWVVDADRRPAGIANEADAYLAQATATLREVARLLDWMRAKGVYDRAAIVVHGDHGINLDSDYLDLPGKRSARILRGMALLAVKQPGAASGLAISRAPTMLTDIPGTVLKWAGLPADRRGRSVDEIAEDEDRLRSNVPVWFYYTDQVMSIYDVRGSIYDEASWRLREARRIAD